MASRERERPELETKAGGQAANSIWRHPDPPDCLGKSDPPRQIWMTLIEEEPQALAEELSP
jgi:hypothetical protein